MHEGLFALWLALGAIMADALAAPRADRRLRFRSLAGTGILLNAAALVWGLVVILTGASMASAGVTIALAAALTLISNIKRKVLGEPLVFTDLALIGAVFRHPHFYLSALRPYQMGVLGLGFLALVAALVWLATGQIAPRLAGLGVALAAGALLAAQLGMDCWRAAALTLEPEADVQRHGLVASLLVHWHHWRCSGDPPPCSGPPMAGKSRQLVVIVQCESFTDPAALFGDPALALGGLERARALAWQSGRLQVAGFGAYTMRTEYGVLFGRGEEALGIRRFDPFLTAGGEASWALPNRLDPSEWDSWFVHPHDLRFYGRDQLMPAAGFGALVGQECFAPPALGEGRYVTDAAMTDALIALAKDTARAGLIYAVTIENHGPWPASKGDAAGAPHPYLALLRRSDAMLVRLLEALPQLGRPVTLCFFGDHRPSIPGVSEPGPERHTPYVLMRFASDGTPLKGDGADQHMTPAELHHAILDAIRLGEAER